MAQMDFIDSIVMTLSFKSMQSNPKHINIMA
jgi:hypothetical protein